MTVIVFKVEFMYREILKISKRSNLEKPIKNDTTTKFIFIRVTIISYGVDVSKKSRRPYCADSTTRCRRTRDCTVKTCAGVARGPRHCIAPDICQITTMPLYKKALIKLVTILIKQV